MMQKLRWPNSLRTNGSCLGFNMSGGLYQLHSHMNLSRGDCVLIQGPYDMYGLVLSKLDGVRDNRQLYLIRGTGQFAKNFPVHETVSFFDDDKGRTVKEVCSPQAVCHHCGKPL